ncbi:MAG TPA: hypothetical protein VH496_20270 [Mycobacterium sp.]|jgi:hypothetical protein
MTVGGGADAGVDPILLSGSADAHGMALDSGSNRLYVRARFGNDYGVWVINTIDHTVLDEVSGNGPTIDPITVPQTTLDMDAKGNRLY